MKSKVAVLECDYDKDLIRANLLKAFDFIGTPDFYKKKVLIKPNLLMAIEPERAVTTHPLLIEVIVEIVKEKKAEEVYIGDTPGNTLSNIENLYLKTGMKDVAEKTGAKLVNFLKEGIVNIPNNGGIISSFPVSKIIEKIDYIINVPKLKTHSFTLMTCAIKNIFGLIPGFNKSRMHAIAPKPKDFSRLLVELFEKIKPNLNIVDAIIGMEGEGPSAGVPRRFGKIIVGYDAVAVDTIASLILGYKPVEIYTTVIAYKKGLGEMDLSKIEILGAKIEDLYNADVKKLIRLHDLTNRIPNFLANFILPIFSRYVKLYPVIVSEKCIKCKICSNSCPQKAIDLIDSIMKIDYKKCISCFCCHELCSQRAIRIEKSFIAKKIWR
ncbi:MAG: DUF362 domain-containing protein [Dictyoglomaceae bacterium]